MEKFLELSVRFLSMSALTVLIFFGGLIARLSQDNIKAKEKLSKGFGLNTAHADFTTVTVEGVVEGSTAEGDAACETESADGDGEGEGESEGEGEC